MGYVIIYFKLLFIHKIDMYNVTLFGTCRLNSLSNYNLSIRDNISYTYDTKELLEVIKYIKYKHIPSAQTITTFRTPMITKIPLEHEDFSTILTNTDMYVIEISGKKTYKYNNVYVHSALSQFSNDSIASQIIINTQDDYEIENDIINIINELNTSNIIIVSHLVTHNYGDRYELSTLLEKICIKHNLGFINPVRELTKNGYDIHQLVENEKKIYHYSNEGHTVIKTIYEEYIKKYASVWLKR